MKKIIGIATLSFLLDQMIKYIVLLNMTFGKTIPIIPDFFSFTLVKNTGVAFSLFAGSQIPLILLSFLIFIVLWCYIKKQNQTIYSIISFGLILGGMFGNLVDRIFQKGVIDYFDFQILGYNAPIFNLADICVVIGALLFIFVLWKEDQICHNTK